MNILGSILDGWFFWMNIVDMILNWILKWIVFNVWINNWNLSPRFTLWGLRLTEQECSIWIGMVNGEMVVFINNNNSQLVNWQGHKGGGHGGRGGDYGLSRGTVPRSGPSTMTGGTTTVFRCASISSTYPGLSVILLDFHSVSVPETSQSVETTLRWPTWWPTWRWTRWPTW